MAEEFKPGLEGIVAARTGLSLVDDLGGRLVVRGRHIEEITAEAGFEAMAALLWQDLLPGDLSETSLQARLGAARCEAAELLPNCCRNCCRAAKKIRFWKA